MTVWVARGLLESVVSIVSSVLELVEVVDIVGNTVAGVIGGVAKELPATTLYNTAWVEDGVRFVDIVSTEGIVVPNSGEECSSPLSSLLELEVTGDAQEGRNISSTEGIGSLDTVSGGVGPLDSVSAEGDAVWLASFGWDTISVWSLFLQLPSTPCQLDPVPCQLDAAP